MTEEEREARLRRLATNVRYYRDLRGMSREDLAYAVRDGGGKVSHRTLGKLEMGDYDRQGPGVLYLESIAEALGVTLVQLLNEDHEPSSSLPGTDKEAI